MYRNSKMYLNLCFLWQWCPEALWIAQPFFLPPESAENVGKVNDYVKIIPCHLNTLCSSLPLSCRVPCLSWTDRLMSSCCHPRRYTAQGDACWTKVATIICFWFFRKCVNTYFFRFFVGCCAVWHSLRITLNKTQCFPLLSHFLTEMIKLHGKLLNISQISFQLFVTQNWKLCNVINKWKISLFLIVPNIINTAHWCKDTYGKHQARMGWSQETWYLLQ